MTSETMNNIDYSQVRSIADEPHWNTFVQRAGGELVAPLIKRQGVKNADYLFRQAKVIAELKVLETEFAHSKEMIARVNALIAKYPGVNLVDAPETLQREIFLEFKKPLQRIINTANRQIKQTKHELGLSDHHGVLIFVNDNFRGLPPPTVLNLIGHIMSGTSYKSISAIIYQTNHYVEMVEVPYVTLLWYPMYSPEAGQELATFVNDLGTKWGAFAEEIDGPFDFCESRLNVQIDKALVVDGVLRKRRFEG